MMKFTYKFDKKAPLVSVTIHSDSTLPEVLEAFEGFLIASGYSFDGHLDFIDEKFEEDNNNEVTTNA